jgi:transmembrane sensor
MNSPTPSRPHDHEAIEATAAAWLAERDDGFTPQQQAQFERWRQADRRHAAAVDRLEQTWTALKQLREYRPEALVHPDRDLLARPRTRKVVLFPALVTALAAAAVIALAAVWFWPRATPASAVQPDHFATTTGGYQRTTLTDGSVVELNASSEVRVHYTAAERRVQLVRGEANFTVAKNRERPFWVEAGTVAVRAVGTAFNVRMDARAVEVLVTEGKVQVDRTAVAGAAVPAAQSVVAIPVLSAGQRATVLLLPDAVAAPAPQVELVAPEVMREALAWQGPRLVFSDTPLSEVVAQFNRRNQVQLVLGDAELGALPVGGSFRAENVEAFVRLLASDADIAVTRDGPDRIVLRKAR